jgi:hypothetical protein
MPFEYWEAINPGMNLAVLPLGDIANAVIYSEADNFLDKIYVERGMPGSLKLYSVYLPIIIKSPPAVAETSPVVAENSSLPKSSTRPSINMTPSINIVWPPNGASVIVEQDLTNEADDFRLTIHGTVHGMSPGWTIRVEVFTDAWYPQEAPTIRGELWGARVSLAGQGAYNNHKIRGTLRDEKGALVATTTVTNVVRLNPCQAP